MRKKFIITLAILLMITLSLCLVACGKTDYSGDATITINFDKSYDNLTVNCPEGEITKNSDVKFTVKLKNTLPVDIVLACSGYETIILSYTTDMLKENKNISEKITFKNEKYRFYFKIAEEIEGEISLAKDYKGIEIASNSGTYVLESNAPIREDIELFVGDKYQNVILFEKIIKYTGSIGKYSKDIPLIEKNSNKAVIYLYGGSWSLALQDVYNYDANNANSINFGYYNVVDIKDYAYIIDGEFNLISSVDLENNRYSILKAKDTFSYGERYKYTYTALEGDILFFSSSDISFWVDYNKKEVETDKELQAGDRINFLYNNVTHYHIITEEEMESKVLNLENSYNKDTFKYRKFKLAFVDTNGKPLVFEKATINSNNYNKDTIFTYTESTSFYLEISNGVAVFSGDIEGDIFNQLYKGSADSVAEIDIAIEYEYLVTIKYFDVISNQFLVKTDKKHMCNGKSYKFEMIFDTSTYSLIREYYLPMSNNSIIYYNQIFGSEIVIDVVKAYGINLNFTNYDEIYIDSDNTNLNFVAKNGNLKISYNMINSQGKIILSDVLESYAGETIQFVMRDREGNAIYSFTLSLPDDLSTIGDSSINVEIEAIDDEW